jgi:HSP20 family protein
MARRRELRDEIDELFADLWQVSRLSGLRRRFRPQLDCFRSEEPPSYTVLLDIAGIDPDDVHVTAGEQAIAVRGERRRVPLEGAIYQQMEIDYGPFERVVHLPDDADLTQAEARYDRGLLTIEIPVVAKPPQAQTVLIEVRRHR